MVAEIGWLVLGLVVLLAGGELLVRGSSRLAAAAGMSPLLVGLTVVAFGTSAPELGASVTAALDGSGGIAVGNVLGSNVFNVLFILGVSALVSPLAVAQKLVRVDVPLMVAVTGLAWWLAKDERVTRSEGALLAVGLVAWTVGTVVAGRREAEPVRAEYEEAFGAKASRPRVAPSLALVALGLVALVLGSRWLVTGAVAIARALGTSELVIGLTIVAAGTSLPEVATSVLATLRGERDIAVGNVVGSNLFNLLGVLGAAACAAPGGLAVDPAALGFDFPVALAAAAACLPIFATGHLIARWEGALFLGYYIAYAAFLALGQSGADAVSTPARVALLLAPLLAATAVAVIARR